MEQVCCFGQPDLAREALGPGAEERYADTVRALRECDADAQFEFGLASLIAGFAARFAHAAGPRRN